MTRLHLPSINREPGFTSRQDNARFIPRREGAQLRIATVGGILRRHLFLIITTGFFGSAVAVGAGIMLQSYVARALILAAPMQGPSGRADPSGDEQMVIETHITSLMSSSAIAALSQSLLSLAKGEEPSLSPAKLEKHLKVQQEMHSRVISIAFTSHDAKLAETVANRAASLYIAREEQRDLLFLDAEVTRNGERKAAALKMLAGLPASASPEQRLAAERQVNEATVLLDEAERASEARRREGPGQAGVSLLSGARRPERPATGSPVLLAIPGFLAFAMLGSFLALFIEGVDTRLRDPGAAELELGVPCAGLLPRLDYKHKPYRIAAALAAPRPGAFAASLHAIAIVQGFNGQSGFETILVTAAVAGDGQDRLALALAAAAVALGRRTLVVNLLPPPESRWPRREAIIDLGISDIIARKADLKDVVKHGPGYDEIGAGAASQGTARLLTMARLVESILDIGRGYERVIIIGPALLAGPEGLVIAGLVDRVIIAVRWGVTRRDFATEAAAVALSRQKDHGICNSVLIDVNLRRHARYRFGDQAEALYRFGSQA